MKLNRTQISAVRHQTGYRPLPDETAEEAGLKRIMGDQTFYVDPEGVYVFDAVEAPSGQDQLMAIQLAEVERVEEKEGEVLVRPVSPRATSLTVDLG